MSAKRKGSAEPEPLLVAFMISIVFSVTDRLQLRINEVGGGNPCKIEKYPDVHR